MDFVVVIVCPLDFWKWRAGTERRLLRESRDGDCELGRIVMPEKHGV